MKCLNVLLLSFLFLFVYSFSLQAQGDDPPVPNFLFLFGQVDVSAQTTITHTLTAQGTYWEYDDGELPISTDSELAEAYAVITGSTTPEPSYSGSGAWKGFIFPWIAAPYEYTDDIAYGFYKVTNSYNNDYFYIDIRDCKYAGGCTYYNPDFFIKFYKNLNVFKWKTSGGVWTSISTGEVLNVWDICNNGTQPTTSYFEDFWENALVMANNESDHPRIVWGPHPSFSTTHFYIYRAISDLPFDPKEPLNFLHCGTRSASIYEFIDSEFEIGGSTPNYMASYRVKAYNSVSETFSLATNGVNTTGEYVPYKISVNPLERIQLDEFGLMQNFPNPFNPTTQIDYTINSAGFVTIKVYDALGNEIASLVNERKQPGNYSTTFDAANLPSGIYVYRIVSGKFQATKKMILLK